MSFRDRARHAVLEAAALLERESQRIDVLRSLDATEAARWLRSIVVLLRKEAEDYSAGDPVPEEKGQDIVLQGLPTVPAAPGKMTIRSGSGVGDVPAGSICFDTGDRRVLELRADGEILVHGNHAATDLAVVKGLREWLAAASVERAKSS